jgi:hypothetical protein
MYSLGISLRCGVCLQRAGFSCSPQGGTGSTKSVEESLEEIDGYFHEIETNTTLPDDPTAKPRSFGAMPRRHRPKKSPHCENVATICHRKFECGNPEFFR